MASNQADSVRARRSQPFARACHVLVISFMYGAISCGDALAVQPVGVQSARVLVEAQAISRSQSTFFGGNRNEVVAGIAVDPANGDVLVAGRTYSTDLACNAGCIWGGQPFHAADDGNDDGFIARFSWDLKHLLQLTYFGGNGFDDIREIAVHPTSGEILLAGHTSSTDLPCTTAATAGCHQAAQPTKAGEADGFVARLSPNLGTLLQVTYLGGSSFDFMYLLTVDQANDEILVGGTTYSSDLPCTSAKTPGCGNGAQMANGGRDPLREHANGVDAYVARLSSDLTTLRQVTYVGGVGDESLNSIVIDPATREILLSGSTYSADFPCTSTATAGCGNGAQPVHAADGNDLDGYVMRVSRDLTSFRQATYFGGSGGDLLGQLVVDPHTGEILVAGGTRSIDLPCVSAKDAGCGDGAQAHYGGNADGFVVRLSADLSTVRQATYVGGSGFDNLTGIALHPVSGELFVSGSTYSTDFRCTGKATPGCGEGTQPEPGGAADAYVARLSADLTRVVQATYLGGSKDDHPVLLIVDSIGDILIAGWTYSADFPCVTRLSPGCGDGAQPARGNDGSGHDGFVARLTPSLTRTDPALIPESAIEFHNSILDHYFLTIDMAEAKAIDAGSAGPGWKRTGISIPVYRSAVAAPTSAMPACRFYGNQENGGPNGHFYTADAAECLAVRNDSGWRFERQEFLVTAPINGICASGDLVFRVYNGRFAERDSNHRYVIDPATYLEMIALGWKGEGPVFCGAATAIR